MAQTEAAAFLIGDVYLRTACTGVAPRQVGNAVRRRRPARRVSERRRRPLDRHRRRRRRRVAAPRALLRMGRTIRRWRRSPAALPRAPRSTPALAEWTRARDAEAAAATLQAAGVSAMAVLGPDELRADPHLQARQAIVTVEHPEIGPERHIAHAAAHEPPGAEHRRARAAARRGHGGCARAHPRRLGRGRAPAHRRRRVRVGVGRCALEMRASRPRSRQGCPQAAPGIEFAGWERGRLARISSAPRTHAALISLSPLRRLR